MAYRTPFLQVTGPGGEDMLKTWGGALIGVKLIDRDGDESDEAHFMFTHKPPFTPLPDQDAPYTVSVGWSAGDVAIGGVYMFQRAHIFGEPGQGRQRHLICRAGDLTDYLKRADSQHFDGDTGHKTLGDVFQSLFKDSGKTVTVHPDIAAKPMPGSYTLRWNQSAIDMAQQLAEDNGAYVKPSGGGIAILKRGSGQSASGQPLPTITMVNDAAYDFDVELEPRFAYSKVSATYLDTTKGTLERVEQASPKGAIGGGGAGAALPHPLSSRDDAGSAGAAAAADLARFTGQGLFGGPGDPAAVSGAPVKCSGYDPDIDAVPWIATTVTQLVVPDTGWTVTVETEFQA